MLLVPLLGKGGHLVPEELVSREEGLRLLRQRCAAAVAAPDGRAQQFAVQRLLGSLYPRASSAVRTMRQALE